MMSRTYTLVILSAASIALISCGEDSSSQSPYDIDDRDNPKAPAPEELGVNPQYISYCEVTSDYGDDGTIDTINKNTFDEQGRLIKSQTVNADGITTMLLEHTYDDKNRLIKAYITLDHPASHHQEYGVNYTYDTQDRLKSCTSIASSLDPSIQTIFESTEKYTYDNLNRLQSMTHTKRPDEKYTYEHQKNKIIVNFKSDQGTSYLAYNFNEDGNLERIMQPYQGEEVPRTKLEWDENQNMASITFNRTKTIYKYNKANKLISEQEYNIIPEEFGNKIEILRDVHNNIIKIIPQPRTSRADNRRITRKNNQISIYNNDKNLETSLYNYDKNGNLITYTGRIKLTNGIGVVKQTFNYDCFKNQKAPQPPPKYNYNNLKLKQKDYEKPQCHLNNLSHQMSISQYSTTHHGELGRILNEFDY